MFTTIVRSSVLFTALVLTACEWPTVCQPGFAENPETGLCEPYQGPVGNGGDTAGLDPNAPHFAQQTPVWCWAATIAMASEAAGLHAPRQCELASIRIGQPTGYCCSEGYGLNGFACNQTAQVYEMTGVMNAIGLDVQLMPDTVPAEALARDIDAGLAVIIGFTGLQGGHVMIVDAYVETSNGPVFGIYDPYTNYYQAVPYYQMGTYGPSNWSVTFMGIDLAADLRYY